jgi:hypothetical protein
MEVMTPDQFVEEIHAALKKSEPGYGSFDCCPEECHALTDTLMEDLLKALGYGQGIDLIRDTVRWYA